MAGIDELLSNSMSATGEQVAKFARVFMFPVKLCPLSTESRLFAELTTGSACLLLRDWLCSPSTWLAYIIGLWAVEILL